MAEKIASGISEADKEVNVKLFNLDDGVKVMWYPDNENVRKCLEYWNLFADNVSN